MIDCKRCGVQTSSDVAGWHADCELIQKLEKQLAEQKILAGPLTKALYKEMSERHTAVCVQLAELRELTQRMYTHVTEDMGEMTSAEFEEWMMEADAALLQEQDK